MLKISRAESFDQAWFELNQAAKLLGLKVPYYICCYVPELDKKMNVIESENHLVYKDDYPDELNDTYISRGFVDYDLALNWMRTEDRSALFSEIFQPVSSGELTGKHKEFYDFFSHVISSVGAIIPIKINGKSSFGGLTVLPDLDMPTKDAQELISKNLETMEILAYTFHNSRPLNQLSIQHYKLTELEQEILVRLCMGKRAQQIAFEQGKFVGVIEKKIATIKKKLNAKTLQQATALASHFEIVNM